MYKFECKDDFKEFLINIKEYFKTSKSSIHKARNELKIISYKDREYVIKSFKVLNLLRRVIYTFFASSKAKRSYQNSLKLKEFAPTPIGYIEFYKSGLLYDSYFVSQKFEYDFTIREVLLDKSFKGRETIFKEFAKFTFLLHERGIFHKDYSPGNILIKKQKDNYIFKVVDLNRMDFKTLSLNDRMKNFNKLWASDEDIDIMISEYANFFGDDKSKMIRLAQKYNQKNKDIKNFKKRLKGERVVD